MKTILNCLLLLSSTWKGKPGPYLREKFLRGMDPDKKKVVVRELNRVYSQRFQTNQDFKNHINRVVTFRLQDLKHEMVRIRCQLALKK